MLEWIQNADWAVLDWIQDIFRCSFLDAVFPKLTLLGNIGIIWIIAGLVLVCHKKYRARGLMVWCGLLMGLLIGNIIIKNAVARPRPFHLDPSIRLLIKTPSEYSFPSGHTLSSFIAATVLSRSGNKIIVACAWVMAALIAFSRLYLQVHFPTDVLFGIVLGVAIGTLTCFVGERVDGKIRKI